jgi:hypothetical protein
LDGAEVEAIQIVVALVVDDDGRQKERRGENV